MHHYVKVIEAELVQQTMFRKPGLLRPIFLEKQ
jgi:hypothetical protein